MFRPAGTDTSSRRPAMMGTLSMKMDAQVHARSRKATPAKMTTPELLQAGASSKPGLHFLCNRYRKQICQQSPRSLSKSLPTVETFNS